MKLQVFLLDFLFCFHNAFITKSILLRVYLLLIVNNKHYFLLKWLYLSRRFVLINCYPLYSSVYNRLNVGLMIAFCWSFSYVILVPTLAGQWGHFGYDEASFSCTILRGDDGRSPKKFLFILAFLMPTVTIIICYSCIFYKVSPSSVAKLQVTSWIYFVSSKDI